MTSIAVLSHCEGNVRRLSAEPCVSLSVLNFAYGRFVGGWRTGAKHGRAYLSYWFDRRHHGGSFTPRFALKSIRGVEREHCRTRHGRGRRRPSFFGWLGTRDRRRDRRRRPGFRAP